MGFDDRLSLFLLGCLIGSVVGYFVRFCQEIREKLNEVDEHVKDAHHAPRDEQGFMKNRVVANLMMVTVLALTAWAAISTQKVNNDLKDTQADLATAQERIEQIVLCTSKTFGLTLVALNERTTYSGAQATANVELQKAQSEMLNILIHEPPYPESERDAAVRKYVDALAKFLDLSRKQDSKVSKFEYPTVEDFASCLSPSKEE